MYISIGYSINANNIEIIILTVDYGKFEISVKKSSNLATVGKSLLVDKITVSSRDKLPLLKRDITELLLMKTGSSI